MDSLFMDPYQNTCPRTVRRHKYERLSKNNQIWWNNKFKELEDDIRIPGHKKYSELRKIFTKNELKSLQAAGLDFDIDESHEKHHKKKRRNAYARRKSTFQSSIFVPRRRASLSTRRDTFVDRLIGFSKKPPEEAKVWLTKQKRELDETIDLLEKAALVEEELAEDFDNWFSNIKTYSTSEINKETILNIFEINSSLPINKSVVVNMQLIKSVPDQVAKYLGQSELASSVVVKREIDSDIKASKVKPISIAFNTMLPPNLRKVKYTADNKVKMISSDHKDLETFAAVFKDIMELETSRRFVSWLRNHPSITPPPFLQKSYMASKKRAPKKSFFIKQIYEAKVWTVDRYSKSSSDEGSRGSLSGSCGDDSLSEINFLV